MEKARSLIETEANLDDVEDGFHESQAAGISQGSSDPERAPLGHPSGFLPASASQSGFSPTARGEAGTRSSAVSGVFSGVPGQVSSDRLVDSLQSALGAASRNEAGLGSLQRAIRDASRAFTASRQAQEALTEDLRVMHRGLNELMSEKAAVERYAALLTQERDAALDAAEEARREAKREREFLLREQDRFIQLLLEEHEAELQQLRRGLGQQAAPLTVPGVAPPTHMPLASAVAAAIVVPEGSAQTAEAPAEPSVVHVPESRQSTGAEDPPRPSGAALARLALSSTAAGGAEPHRVVPMPEEREAEADAPTDTRRSEDERSPSYPPAPAVLDLESLAAEVDGNSERPPPIRRVGAPEPKIHLKPARVPTQLFDTLISPSDDPNRKG